MYENMLPHVKHQFSLENKILPQNAWMFCDITIRKNYLLKNFELVSICVIKSNKIKI